MAELIFMIACYFKKLDCLETKIIQDNKFKWFLEDKFSRQSTK